MRLCYMKLPIVFRMVRYVLRATHHERKRYSALFFMFSFIAYTHAHQNNPSPEIQETKAPRKYHVRVLLQECSLDQKIVITGKGFIIADPATKTKSRSDTPNLTVAVKKHYFVINGTVYDAKRLYIHSLEGHLIFEGKEYQGSFLIVHDHSCLYLINSIELEEYVCSVLKTESWPGWPLEVNKAFAIASRSYVIGVVLHNPLKNVPYHVKNTNKHQTYTGVHTNLVLKEAVEQTRGIFLAYESKPIIAMFDSCCGGVIPAYIQGVNFIHAPYLARNYACTFCKDCKMFNWTARYSCDQFEKIMQEEYKNFKKMKGARVTKTDKAGLVQQVSFKGNKSLVVPGKKIYSILDKVKSFCFDVGIAGNEITFKGKGIGHHMGICQWGAREMLRQGYDFKSILSFYYPGTHLMRLA